MHDCKACPGDNGKVCYGRGSCFDDVAGKAHALGRESTARLIATGNGSCMAFAQLVPKRMMEVALLALLGPSRQKVALAGFAFQEHFPTQEAASV